MMVALLLSFWRAYKNLLWG